MRKPTALHLEKARTAAIAAIEVYNKPGSQFRTAHFIVLITIAWTALFHSVFFERGVKPYYSKGSGTGTRYDRVDGEYKHWDLTECLKKYYGDQNPPERSNIQFLIGLRNRIEHREIPEFEPTLYGECQSTVMNFEDILTKEFGAELALTDQLQLALQFSRASSEEQAAATRRLASSTVKTVVDYVETFRRGLPPDTLQDEKYRFSFYLVPKLANRASAADISMDFVRYDKGNAEEAEELQQIVALIKHKKVRVINTGLLKPSQVVAKVQEKLPYPFNISTHTKTWKYYRVRPDRNSDDPHNTREEFCFYDEVHKDYLYTTAWVKYLVRRLAKEDEYLRVVS